MSEYDVRIFTTIPLLQQEPISLSDLIGIDIYTTKVRFSLSCNGETYYVANLKDCKDINEMVITALKAAAGI